MGFLDKVIDSVGEKLAWYANPDINNTPWHGRQFNVYGPGSLPRRVFGPEMNPLLGGNPMVGTGNLVKGALSPIIPNRVENPMNSILQFANKAGGVVPGVAQSMPFGMANRLLRTDPSTLLAIAGASPSDVGKLIRNPIGTLTAGDPGDTTTTEGVPNDRVINPGRQYDVVNKLTGEQMNGVFEGKDSNAILEAATRLTLDTMKGLGYTITPEMYETVAGHALAAAPRWGEERVANGQDRSAYSFFLFLTQIAQAALANPQTSTDTVPDTTNTAADVTIPMNPETNAPYGSQQLETMKSPKDTYQQAEWGSGKWGEGKSGVFGVGPYWAQAYNDWAAAVMESYGNTVDVSPEAWERYWGFNQFIKDYEEGRVGG